MVSIRCTTYNHAPYIEDAMNGFCMQQTDFSFVAVIIDDASTDGEPDVIRKYLDDHFDMPAARQWETDDAHFIEAQHKENKNCAFAVVLLKYNFWQAKKDKNPLIKEWMDTKYIALCEGDDYWTDPNKLQIQVNFLESHPDYGMIYTNHQQYVQSENKFITGWSKKSCFKDMLYGNKICTLTVCIKNTIYQFYNDNIGPIAKMRKWLMGDYPLWLYIFAESNAFFLDDVTGVYRVLQNSMSHFTSFEKREKFILSTLDIQLYFAHRYKFKHIEPCIVKRNLSMIVSESDIYNQSTKLFFFPYFMKYRLESKFYINAISTHTRVTRAFFFKIAKMIECIR